MWRGKSEEGEGDLLNETCVQFHGISTEGTSTFKYEVSFDVIEKESVAMGA